MTDQFTIGAQGGADDGLPIAIPVRPCALPEPFALDLQRLHEDGHPQLSQVLKAAVEAGWTYQQLADGLGVTRQAVERRVKNRHLIARPEKQYLDPETRERLKAMHSVARTVNGGMAPEHPARRVGEEFSALLADLVNKGFTVSVLAKSIGVTHHAISARLYRHGYRENLPPSQPRERYQNRKNTGPRKRTRPEMSDGVDV